MIFNNNKALGDGGAFYMYSNSDITVKDYASIKFNNNKASHYGGALYVRQSSDVTLEETTSVMFYDNTANTDGGALYIQDKCNVIIKGNCKAIFDTNKALGDGGALYISVNSAIIFQENAAVNFKNNVASYLGGGIYSNFNIKFIDNCIVLFVNNEASQGGAIFSKIHTEFKGNSTVKFYDNRAITQGGALYVSNLMFDEKTVVTFENNEALLNGGALYTSNSSIAIKQNSTVILINNIAQNGGAAYISASAFSVTEHSNVTFNNNTAKENGGAFYFIDQINVTLMNSSTVTFNFNAADKHGGAIYSEIMGNADYFDIIEIKNFSKNIARVAGNLLYIDIPKSCDENCFTKEILTEGINLSDDEVATSPVKLRFYHPARCINANNTTSCEKYYINNIMLGQELTIDACLLDYYDKPTEVMQFKIIGKNHQNYLIHGSEYASISCNHTIEGINIIGSKPISNIPLNYSVHFTADASVSHKPIRRTVSVSLIVGLSPCHPGFQYDSKSQQCICYNTNGVVYCSGSSSAIRRGYWFGNVDGIPTITFCPINYCNFTCYKTTNGYYELSPVRVNQCKSHRSGTACGSCEEGYTLSFDSAECVSVNKCTTGQTILIIILTVFYWIVIVVIVFINMYFQVGIGYSYAFTYYFSIVDMLLHQHTDLSYGLYIIVTIMSSIAKVTTQFLGHLCLLENMSGIDQQFIHYIHPLAITMMLILVCWLAHKSKRLSIFISRGIICAICFLLLLSYISTATTSLLLMRSLTFVT